MTDQPPPPPFRLPTSGPSLSQVADRDLWDKATDASLATVQAAAEKWRTGLAAFVTLVTSGLLIKGPEAAKDLTTEWRLAITILGGGGMLLAVLGLWQALKAAAGAPSSLRYETIVTAYGSFKQYQIASAQTAAKTLAVARRLVGWSLILLAATVIAWWWAPTEPSPVVKAQYGDKEVCGTLSSADDQTLSIKAKGTSKATEIPFAEIKNLYVTDKC